MKSTVAACACAFLCFVLRAQAQAPSLVVTPPDQTIIATAQQASFAVQTSGRWSASSDQSWATVSRAEQQGNGVINVTIAVNLNAGPRTATITVTGVGTNPPSVQVRLTQAPPASLTVTPDPLDVNDLAQQAEFTVDTTARWSATSDQPWAVVQPVEHNGSGPLAVFVGANFGPARSAVITVRGEDPTEPRTVEVTLNQAEQPPALSATPPQQEISSSAQTANVFVTTTDEWTAESDQPWATVPAGPVTGAANLAVAVTGNDSGASRTATITITGATSRPATVTVEITQNTVPGLAVTPAFLSVDEDAQELEVEVDTPGEWTASSNVPWAAVTSEPQTGPATLAITLEENTAFEGRSGLITITGDVTAPGAVSVSVFQGATPAPGCDSIDDCRATLLSNFGRGDVNNDRALSLEEAQDILAGLTIDQFNEIDRNHDGQLRMLELRPMQSLLLILLGLVLLLWQGLARFLPQVG